MIKTPKRYHHFLRLKNKRQSDMVYRSHFDSHEFKQGFDDTRQADKILNCHITTPAMCSCWMCGNPRKFFGNGKNSLTMQQRKAKNDEDYQLKYVS